MKTASQRIADGRYEERVQVSGEDELAELGRSFNRMAHELAQTEERRRRLIGDVAHKLRTPLSSIKSVMEGLQGGFIWMILFWVIIIGGSIALLAAIFPRIGTASKNRSASDEDPLTILKQRYARGELCSQRA